MNKLPKAKLENIVEQDLSDELLIYNQTTHQAYTLNSTSKRVFNHCDGRTTFDDLKRRYKFTDDLIHLALAELSANDLLDNYESRHFAGLSRRDVIKKVGLGTMVALPVIASLTAPSAAQASSACLAINQPYTVTSSGCQGLAAACQSQQSRCCSGSALPARCALATGETICRCA